MNTIIHRGNFIPLNRTGKFSWKQHQYSRLSNYFRRNHYNLNNNCCRETHPTPERNRHFPLVTQLRINGDISTHQRNSIDFPKVTKLMLRDYSNESLYSISMILDRLIPLKQLLIVELSCSQICISQLMDLLYFSPNIQVLELSSVSLAKISLSQIRSSQTFQTILKINRINRVTLTNESTLDSIELFYQLCPRLQRLNIDVKEYNDPNIRIAFGQLVASHHVPLLCLSQADPIWQTILRRDLPSNDCMKLIGSNLYLCS